MDISTVIKAMPAPRENRTVDSLVELKPGDQLTGRVLRIENDGRVLMELGGQRALARIGFSVKPGQILQLHVVETEKILHLQVDSSRSRTRSHLSLPNADFSQALSFKDQGKFIGIAQRLMGGFLSSAMKRNLPKSIQNAMVQIKTLFEEIPMERSAEQIGQWLKNTVENRGILFEKKMADLLPETLNTQSPIRENNPQFSPVRILITQDVKSQLLHLKRYLAQTVGQDTVIEKLDSKEIQFLHRCVDRMLAHIEQQQNRAMARWEDGGNRQVFVHTMPMPNQSRPVQFKVYYPRKDGLSGDQRQHRIALLLNLDRLGDVRVDLAMADQYLDIGFFVENPGIQQFMAQHVKKVEASLTDHFDKIMINVVVSKKRIAQFETEDLSEGDDGRINLSI